MGIVYTAPMHRKKRSASIRGRLEARLKDALKTDCAVQKHRNNWSGLYHGSRGMTCEHYSEALSRHGFRPFAGDGASRQPPDIADLLLHELVAAGIRKHFKGKPLQWVDGDQEANYKKCCQRSKECEKHINKHYNLKHLSLSFPRRVEKCLKDKGRRQRWWSCYFLSY